MQKKTLVYGYGFNKQLLSVLLSLVTVAGMFFWITAAGVSGLSTDVFALEDVELNAVQNNANESNTKLKIYFDNTTYKWSQVYAYVYNNNVNPLIENRATAGRCSQKQAMLSATGIRQTCSLDLR